MRSHHIRPSLKADDSVSYYETRSRYGNILLTFFIVQFISSLKESPVLFITYYWKTCDDVEIKKNSVKVSENVLYKAFCVLEAFLLT